MVKLARQLIDRQAGRYGPTDIEDRYEARLRELKGEGLAPEDVAAACTSNVADLMAALRRSVEQSAKDRDASRTFSQRLRPLNRRLGKPRKQTSAAAPPPTPHKKTARHRA